MPFVERNDAGAVIGRFSVPQPDKAEEWLDEGHPDLAPPPPPLRPLTPRQFWLAALSLGVREDEVDALIAAMPDDERRIAEISKKYASQYERDHPLVLSLPTSFELTDEQIDAAWRQAMG